MKIKRYSFDLSTCGGDKYPYKDDKGDWVKFEDVNSTYSSFTQEEADHLLTLIDNFDEFFANTEHLRTAEQKLRCVLNEREKANISKTEKHRENIQAFANQHKLIFEDEGECGFGRECVGLLSRTGCYVSFNPRDYVKGGYIAELYDERFDEISPEDAYHKYFCFAVLGRGEEAIKQLSEWVDKLKELNVEIVEFKVRQKEQLSEFPRFFSFDYAFKAKDKIKGERSKKHTRIKNFKKFEFFKITHDKANEKGYCVLPALTAKNEKELKEKIDSFLNELLANINEPLETCSRCEGHGYLNVNQKMDSSFE